MKSSRLSLASLVAFCALASTPAAAQSLKPEDAGNRTGALIARIAAVRSVPMTRDVVRLTAVDSTPSFLVTPYRSAPSEDNLSSGFSMRLPGTGLDLTNGSISIRRANDGRFGKGVHFSVALTY